MRRLVKEAAITDEQARELVDTLGTNWPSLIYEAREIKKDQNKT
jgi:hypothetical protein